MPTLPIPPVLIVFDFDGVFTDNLVYVGEDGKEYVACSRADGLGISMLRALNIPMCILSTEKNPVVTARANKLNLNAFQGCDDKKKFLLDYLLDKKIDPAHVIYVGNDINDLEVMQVIGYPVCPADAHDEVKAISAMILSRAGGKGAVRELCECVVAAMRS